VLIRLFEERVQQFYDENLLPGTTHLSQGQEAVAVGTVAALNRDDYLTITYRGHGQAIARGVPIEAAFAEILGRATGTSGGLGGSMHLIDASRGLIASSGIVAGGLPIALGAALSAQIQKTGRVAMTFFGDGATNIGGFHETLNMASVWKAPVVFVCENNLYGEFSPIRTTTPIENLADRAAAYGMRGEVVDGNDVELVFERATQAVERARNGDGPTLLECKTYRYRGHSRSDPGKYRPAGELERWKQRDPIELLGHRLTEERIASSTELEQLRQQVAEEIGAAAARAAMAPWPAPEILERLIESGR
jgi:pyruvate dehydrogenase E1 component alpha subunit